MKDTDEWPSKYSKFFVQVSNNCYFEGILFLKMCLYNNAFKK